MLDKPRNYCNVQECNSACAHHLHTIRTPHLLPFSKRQDQTEQDSPMNSPIKQTSTFLTIWLVLAAIDARADLITNGSFESTTTPAVSAGSFQNFGPGSTGIPGWTVVGAAATDVSVVSTTDVESGISYPAEQGSFWLDLTGDASNSDTEGVEQTVSTTIGDKYTLTFWVGNVDNPGLTDGPTSTVNLSINGVGGAYTNSSTNSTTLTWEQFTVPFVAPDPSVTLEFLNRAPGNDNVNGLDNVVLVDNGPASTVPEPSFLMLLGSGLLGLAGFARRRNRLTQKSV